MMELSQRMKVKKKGAGVPGRVNKNKRGDCEDDGQTSTFVYGVLGGASNNDSRPASRADSRPVTPVVVFPAAAAAADVQAEVEFLRAETPEPVAAPSAATASIKLSPAAVAQTPPGSPLVSRVASRARSKS